MSRNRARLRPRREHGHNGPYRTKENMVAKYLLLKHYRGAPASVNDLPMDRWTPEEVSAHMQYMQDFATRLEAPASSSTVRRSPRRARSSATTARDGRRSPTARSTTSLANRASPGLARSGALTYARDGDAYLIVTSKGGASHLRRGWRT